MIRFLGRCHFRNYLEVSEKFALHSMKRNSFPQRYKFIIYIQKSNELHEKADQQSKHHVVLLANYNYHGNLEIKKMCSFEKYAPS